MRSVVVATLCIVLTACATAAGIRDNSAALELRTTKGAEAVAGCVAMKGAEIYGTPSIVPMADGQSVMVTAGGEGVQIVVDAHNDGRVELFMSHRIWFGIDKRYRAAVQSCV
jgi:hypothetical protein